MASSSRHSCCLGRPTIYSCDNLDCRSHLDGHGVHSECQAVWAHSLSLYRPVLPRDDRSSIDTYLRYRHSKFLWVACIGRSYSCWKQNHLVGHRASMGKIFIATGHVRFWRLADNQTAPTFVRFRTKADKADFSARAVCPLLTQSGHSAEPTCRRDARSGNERYERLRQSLRDASLGPASCVPHPATAGARA
jgi:hypothetical protein